MTDAPTNVINMQAKARLIREAQAAREAKRKARAEPVNMPFERLPVCACDPGFGPPPSAMKMISCEQCGRTINPEPQCDPDFPGIPELAHFYKPPGTCEICGSISAPGAKVCLTCAVDREG